MRLASRLCRIILAGAVVAGCAPMSQQKCLESLSHVLVVDDAAPGGYNCRRAANHCEDDFAQAGTPGAECEKKAGCALNPGSCYCPFHEGVQCICAMGPPRNCELDLET